MRQGTPKDTRTKVTIHLPDEDEVYEEGKDGVESIASHHGDDVEIKFVERCGECDQIENTDWKTFKNVSFSVEEVE